MINLQITIDTLKKYLKEYQENRYEGLEGSQEVLTGQMISMLEAKLPKTPEYTWGK